MAAPAEASTSTSVRCWRMIRPRAAPSAMRTATFPAPQRRSRDQQVRHVDARDEQDADSRPEHRHEHRVDLTAEDRFEIGDGAGADAGIGGGKSRSSCAAIVELRGRLRRRYSRLEQADHLVSRPLAPRGRQRIHSQRHPQHLADREAELRRHHADDGHLRGVGANRPADDVRGAAVAIAPQLVPEQHDILAPGVVSFLEPAAEHGLHAECTECLHRQLPPGTVPAASSTDRL